MTDAELICDFMQKRPARKQWSEYRQWKWWRLRPMTDPYTFPVDLDLDALREVEEKLATGGQRWKYADTLVRLIWASQPNENTFSIIHASPEQKIAALASVIRPDATRTNSVSSDVEPPDVK